MKFRAHETFFIRKGWLSKGLKNVVINPHVFMGFDRDGNRINPMDELGIGANMVKSLRYWMQAVGLSREILDTRKKQVFTQLGETVQKNDPYIEESGTLCLLHYELCNNKKFAPSWYFFFNEFSLRNFSKDDFVPAIKGWAKLNGSEPSDRSLEEDFDCIVKTYISRERSGGSAKTTPESSIDCPLGDLELIELAGKKTKSSNYRKRNVSKSALHPLIALALILRQSDGSSEIPIGALLNAQGSVGKAFNLDTIALSSLLSDLDALGHLKIVRTAGLDVVKLTHGLTYDDCVEKYYASISRGSDV